MSKNIDNMATVLKCSQMMLMIMMRGLLGRLFSYCSWDYLLNVSNSTNIYLFNFIVNKLTLVFVLNTEMTPPVIVKIFSSFSAGSPESWILLGMIQQLRNAVVAPTGMGKNYGRIMPLLRQG